MRATFLTLCSLLTLTIYCPSLHAASTPGTAKLEVTIHDYTGRSGMDHYTVAWVTTEGGAFIKSLRKQGPSSWGSSEWANHCGTWNTARAGSTVLDGYTSATARDYSNANSPVIQTWNARDAANKVMPDGNYKFWVQYAENSGQGPVTTAGLVWTKGPAASTNTYSDQPGFFSGMKVTWTPASAVITSEPLPQQLTVGVPFDFTVTATGAPPITIGAVGTLPPGLQLNSSGKVSGVPTTEGVYGGTIFADNGAVPASTQVFWIRVEAVPTRIESIGLIGDQVILSGFGPSNGLFATLISTNSGEWPWSWTAVATNNLDAAGRFRQTNTIDPGVSQKLYRLRVP